jgi:two-component system sensor histidine kinase BaeS
MRLRLLLSFVLVVLVSVTGVVWLARQNSAGAVRAFMYRGGMSGSAGLVTALEDYYRQNGTWLGVESLLDSPGRHGQGGGYGMMGGMMNQRLRVADAQGNVIVDTGSAAGGTASHLSASERDNALPLQVDGRTVGYLVAEGGMPFNQSDETFLLNRLSQAALTAGLVAAGLSLLLALFLAYRLMRPVREMTQAAHRLGQGDLSQRVRASGNDELAVLGQTFNHMADSLQQAEESRRSMTADIAHELRNPLAVQRASLEALQDGVYPLTPENLGPILEQNLLLTRLVDDLRTLALADAGQLQLERTATDLLALAERVVERFRPQALARSVELIMETGQAPGGGYTMSVDPQRIEQVLGNLLSNALRYTPDHGQIVVRVEECSQPKGLRFSVRDSGAGIPAEALPHIFERFYRADHARSRSDGGSGLGLTIARQIVEAHRGTLTAANHPQGGAIFSVTLPKRTAS